MTKVFVSGSMRIKNLDNNIKFRLKHIIDSNFNVLVGDADGVDTSIQEFLLEYNYNNVTVYCTGEQPRNNVGHWKIKNIISDAAPGTRSFFTAKDLAMAEESDFGLMIWDTKSTGTLSNAFQLLKLNKKSRVYINKEKTFIKISSVQDIEHLVSFMSDSAYTKANEKIKIEQQINNMKFKNLELF